MWRRKPRVPKGLSAWPQNAVGIPLHRIIRLYRAGFAGTIYDPEAREALFASVPWPDGAGAATRFGLAESGKGKLTLAYKSAYDHWRCWPAPGQETGSCVGHAGKNAGVVLLGVECSQGTPDEVTGQVEGWPEVSPAGVANGVLCWEQLYGDRGHRGQGAHCSRVIQSATQWGGMLLRQPYPEINLDLTNYQTRLAIDWGGSQTPEAIRAIGRKHQIRTATDCPNHEVCRDFLANGYPIWVCSGLGFSSRRDANGYSPLSGSWAHSWIIGAYDDRPETVQLYGFPLALFIHDWWKWNSGGRRIFGTNIDIPEGCMWINARLLDNCDCTAMSSLNGFPARAIETYFGSIWG